jgi:hypothetical protein
MKLKFAESAAFLIAVFCIVALVLLTGAMANQLISKFWFWFGLAILMFIGYKDSKWIDRHFIDGEWI